MNEPAKPSPSQPAKPAPKSSGKIFLVDRDFQLRLALRGAAIGIVSSLFGLGIILYPLHLFERLPLGTTLPPVIYGGMALAVLANIAAIVSFGIKVSHRVAGPVYSIVRHMRRWEKGHKVNLLHARQSDEMKYLVRNYNNLLVGLELSRQEQLAKLEQVQAALSALPEGQGGPHALGQLSDQLSEVIEDMKEGGLESLPEEFAKRAAAKKRHASDPSAA